MYSPAQGSSYYESPEQWNQQGNVWAQSGWVDFSSHHPHDQGWAPGSWPTGQRSESTHATAPTSQWGSPQREAHQAVTPQAASSDARGAVLPGLRPKAKAAPHGVSAQQGHTQSNSRQGTAQEIPLGDNFNLEPFFQPVPAGTRIHRLLAKFKDFGLPRDPATYEKWQSTYFVEFPPVPEGWIRIWDEVGNSPACFRPVDGATLLGSDPGLFPTIQQWKDRPRRRQGQDMPTGRKKAKPNPRAWLLENLRAARNDSVFISPGEADDMLEEDEGATLPPGQPRAPPGASPGWGAQQHPWPQHQPTVGSQGVAASCHSGGGVAPVSGPAYPPHRPPHHGLSTSGPELGPAWGCSNAAAPAACSPPGIPPPPAPEDWSNKQFSPPILAVSSPLAPQVASLMLNQDNMLPLDWVVPFWPSDPGPPLRELIRILDAQLYPFFHAMAAWTVEAVLPRGSRIPSGLAGWERAGYEVTQVTLNRLPWNAMLQAIIIRAATVRGRAPSPGRLFGLACLRELLQCYGILSREGFAAHMVGFAGRPPIHNLLTMTGGITKELLKKLCVPGAWLLDTVHTLVNAMHGRIQPTCQYKAVSNAALGELFAYCFPDMAMAQTGASQNNRGNQIEALAWLVMEMDRTDLLLAMAFHLDIWTTGGGAASVPGAPSTQASAAAMSSDTIITRDLAAYMSRAVREATAQPTWLTQQPSPTRQQCQGEQLHFPPSARCDSQGAPPGPHPGHTFESETQAEAWDNQRSCRARWNDWGSPPGRGVPFKAAPPLPPEYRCPPPGTPCIFSHLGKAPPGPPPFHTVPPPRQGYQG